MCQNSAPFLPLTGQRFCPLRGRILAPHIFQKKKSKIYNIRRKAFTLLRGNSRDCKGFSCLREISCSVLLYQILSHLSSFIVRDSATDFDITDSSPTPGSLLPSASLPPYWQLSLFCKCQPGHGMGQNRILCGYLLKILFS